MGRVCLLFLLAGQLFAAGADSLWTRRFGGPNLDNAQGGTPDQSGGFVLVGQTQLGGSQNGYLVRVNGLTGDTLFTKFYGGASGDQFSDVHVTAARMVAVGTTSSFGANPGNAWLVCTNAIGDTQWTRTLDFGASDGALAVDYSTDYFVTGFAFASGDPNMFVAKVTMGGTVLWTRTLGGGQQDFGNDVAALSDGGCIVAGETYNFGINAPPFSNLWMVRYDMNGDTLWTKTYGDSGYYERANEIIATADGGFALAGYRDSFTGDQDVLLLKTDAGGNTEWARLIGGGDDDMALDLVESCDGGYLIGGATRSFGAGDNDFYLIRTDSLGDTLWTATYGGTASDICYAVSAKCIPNVVNEGYFAAGSTQSGSSGTMDAWLVRLDAEPWIEVTQPLPCADYVLGSTVTVTWNWEGLAAFPYVTVELNRDYPTGGWELIASNLFNNGIAQFTASTPSSRRCRVRVTKSQGEPAEGLSEPFQIVPPGALQIPSVDWDSLFTGGSEIDNLISLDDGGTVYPYGRSIAKRDSIGAVLWTAFFPYSPQHDVSSRSVVELTNGDLIAVGSVDSSGINDPSSMAVMISSSSGTPLTGAGLRPQGWAAEGVDVAALPNNFYWLLALVVPETGGQPRAAVVRDSGFPSQNLTVLLEAPSFRPTCCAACNGACENEGGSKLCIAGEIGDPFALAQDIYLVLIDSTADTLWTKRLDFGQNEYAREIRHLENGGYVLGGRSFTGVGGTSDYLLVVLDEGGNVVQQWTHDVRASDELGGVIEDTDGGFVIAGRSADSGQPQEQQLIKFGCDGSLIWQTHRAGANSLGYLDVAVTPDGGYIAGGYKFVPGGGGLGVDRPNLVKYGSETYQAPPTCPPADSLVIKFNFQLNANELTWKGEETGSYLIFAKNNFDSTHGTGNGWSQIGCVEPIPPALALFTFLDTDLTPLRKFYYVVHNCDGGCGGSGEN